MDARTARLFHSLLGGRARTRDEELCTHLVSEVARGRRLDNVLRDRAVRERTSLEERRRLARDRETLDRLVDETAATALVRRLRPEPSDWLPPAA